MKSISIHELESSLARIPNKIHFIDVRSPSEFATGAVVGAVNLPILTDEERAQVGISYKADGPESAIGLGNRIVSGLNKKHKIESWKTFVESHDDAVIYCARGGLRSQITSKWLEDSGYGVPYVEGGFKSIRNFFLDVLENFPARIEFKVLKGPTGSGKTEFLENFSGPKINLENLARHRGSSFGGIRSRQPTQIDFENSLALELLKVSVMPGPVLIEAESRMIGKLRIPEKLFFRMQQSVQYEFKCSLDERVDRIYRDYVLSSDLGIKGDSTYFQEFAEALSRLQSKLGGLRHLRIQQILNQCRLEFLSTRGLESNKEWIRELLQNYYDPQYQKGERLLAQKYGNPRQSLNL